METAINSKPEKWSKEIYKLWRKACKTITWEKGDKIIKVNYFTPRPYKNEYDRGSD